MTTQKKYSLIAFAICLVLATSLTLLGCKKGMAITKDDALEVALDYSGFSQEEIQNPTVIEQEDGNKGFLVTFGTPSGDFECVISPKGIMQAQYYSDGRYRKGENDATDEIDSSQPNNAEANNKSESNLKPTDENNSKAKGQNKKESSKENTESQTDNNPTNRTPEEEAALNLALQNVGAEEGDVENISIHPSGSNIEVRFKYGESTNIVTVNPAANSVVSTLFE